MSLWLTLLILASVGGFLVVLFVGRTRASNTSEIGSVSEHWLAEHRLKTHDSDETP